MRRSTNPRKPRKRGDLVAARFASLWRTPRGRRFATPFALAVGALVLVVGASGTNPPPKASYVPPRTVTSADAAREKLQSSLRAKLDAGSKEKVYVHTLVASRAVPAVTRYLGEIVGRATRRRCSRPRSHERAEDAEDRRARWRQQRRPGQSRAHRRAPRRQRGAAPPRLAQAAWAPQGRRSLPEGSTGAWLALREGQGRQPARREDA